jgi:hypothetical protein
MCDSGLAGNARISSIIEIGSAICTINTLINGLIAIYTIGDYLGAKEACVIIQIKKLRIEYM